MIYRVVYKKYSEMAKGFTLVEEDIEAEGFRVHEGNLLFQNGGFAFMAIPMGSWAGVELATVSNTPTLIVGGN